MSTDVNVIEVQIRAQVDQLIKSLKEASTATGSAGTQMRDEMAALGNGARSAEPHLTGLNDALKEWRTHVRTEARYTQFMAMQIANLGIAGKGAAAELTGLVSAFAFGGGVGVAIEGVKLLVHFINEIGSGEKEANKRIQEYGVDAAKSIKSVTEQIDKMIMSIRHATTQEVLGHDIILPLLKDENDKKQLLIAATDKLGAARYAASFSVESEEELAAATKKEAEAVREATAAYEDAKAKRKGAQGDVGRGVHVETGLTKLIEEAKRAEEQATLDNEINLQRIKTEQERGEAKKAAAFEKALDREVAEAKQRQDDAEAESKRNLLRIETEQERKEQADLEAYREREKEYKKLMKERLRDAEQVGSAIGDNLIKMATGAESVEKAFGNMAKAALHAILDSVKKAIEAYALQAAAAAAAANAGIPGVGVFVAMAAAAAMEAAVSALIDSMPQAKTGMSYVPRDMPVFLHQGERVLTAQENASQSGGGAGGGDVHLHFPNALAVDGGTMRRLIRDPNFRRELRDATRTGIL